jgi:hypothetical protein
LPDVGNPRLHLMAFPIELLGCSLEMLGVARRDHHPASLGCERQRRCEPESLARRRDEGNAPAESGFHPTILGSGWQVAHSRPGTLAGAAGNGVKDEHRLVAVGERRIIRFRWAITSHRSVDRPM